MNVADALVIIQQQEADRLLDMDTIKEDAIKRAENAGIVFLDEMDKITHRSEPLPVVAVKSHARAYSVICCRWWKEPPSIPAMGI